MATSTSTTQTEKQVVSLKLFVNKEKKKVIFGEAGKDFVDVLFSFLTLPLGTIARLVSKESNTQPVRVGCLNSLFESVANLDVELLWTETCKEMLLQPRNSAEDYCKNLKLNIDDTEPTKYFVCEQLNCCSNALYSTFKGQRCKCGKMMSKQAFLKSNVVHNGFVNGYAVSFIITDDLIVMPNSLDSSIGLLKSSRIDNVSSVQEITVNVTRRTVLDLLKHSLLSKTTLTASFLEKKPFYGPSEFSFCESEANGRNQINVKLFFRKSDGKIVFAQGEQDFADFLFSFLTFPLGAVLRMLKGGCSSVGSIDGLYKSIVDLDGNKYLLKNEVKNMLVDPRLPPKLKLSKQLLPIYESDSEAYYCYYMKDVRFSGSPCSLTSTYRSYNSQNETYKTLYLVDPKSSTAGPNNGFAKGPSMYMVTDDLVVAPLSLFSGISLLNSLNIPLDGLEEKAVSIGIKEGLSILKASLTTPLALTNGLSHLLTKVKGKK